MVLLIQWEKSTLISASLILLLLLRLSTSLPFEKKSKQSLFGKFISIYMLYVYIRNHCGSIGKKGKTMRIASVC